MEGSSKLQRAAERTFERGRTHVTEQLKRIARQRELIARLEADGHCGEVLREARELLKSMVELLDQMLADQHDARIRASG